MEYLPTDQAVDGARQIQRIMIELGTRAPGDEERYNYQRTIRSHSPHPINAL
jgi:hypothetical protein